MVALATMNAVLFGHAIAALAIWLWSQGRVDAGVVAMALPLAWQIASIGGLGGVEVAGIFENIGTVQEGHADHRRARITLIDRDGRRRSSMVTHGEIVFDDVTFRYGRGGGLIKDFDLTSGRARRSASSAARAPASRRWSTCCCASTTSRAGAS